MTSSKLVCKETVELVTDYLEGALLSELEAQFEAHVATCPGCTNYLAQMRQTLQLLRQLTDDATPTASRAVLLQQFQTWRQHQKSKK
jgi:predicted anti-sigma-YlaC factor YlaD